MLDEKLDGAAIFSNTSRSRSTCRFFNGRMIHLVNLVSSTLTVAPRYNHTDRAASRRPIMGVFGLDSWCSSNIPGRLLAFNKSEPRTLIVDLCNIAHRLYERSIAWGTIHFIKLTGRVQGMQ